MSQKNLKIIIMMKKHLKYYLLLSTLLFSWIPSYSRSPLRIKNHLLPHITVKWADEPHGKSYSLSDSHIEEYPLFTIFDKTKFNADLIPHTNIPYRNNPNISIHGDTLNDLCQELIEEVFQKKKKFKNFTIIQNKNFSHRHKCGLLVLKFKNYPFVVKLFIEDPKTFTNHWWKGFEPIFFWNMGRGAGRHLSGLTRINNKKNIQQQLLINPFYNIDIQMPNKWFWVPKNNRYLQIDGKNIGNGKTLSTQLPSIYAIIADAIDTTNETSLSSEERKQIAIELCNHLNLIVDPHATNFIFKECPAAPVESVPVAPFPLVTPICPVASEALEPKKLTITIIDTEYFPIMVGLKEIKKFKSYEEWYLFLAGKCFKDTFGRTKWERELSYLESNQLTFHYT